MDLSFSSGAFRTARLNAKELEVGSVTFLQGCNNTFLFNSRMTHDVTCAP